MSPIKHLAVLLLLATPVAAMAQTTHTIDQVGTSFSPSEITIEVGDTVRWVWSSGLHTVTNGAGSTAQGAGALFDASLNEFVPSFQFTFTEAGVVPYFCRPHEALGMTGTITVEEIGTDAPAAGRAALTVSGVEPNPFNPRTTIRFTLAASGEVTVLVHDARGRLVRHLAEGLAMDAGERALDWDGRDDQGRAVASGVYRFRVRHAGEEAVVSGVLVR